MNFKVKKPNIKILKFYGTNDPANYFEWEPKVDQIFKFCNFDEDQKDQIASLLELKTMT